MRDYFKVSLQYCDDVRTGVRIAGKLEKLAVKRFLNDLSRSGFKKESVDDETQQLLKKLRFKSDQPDVTFEYQLDLERAHHACFFIETCPHVKGTLAKINKDGSRNLLIMEGWQVFATFNMFGWINYEGFRRFIYSYVEVAKKNGKSTWVAAIGLYMAFIDGEMGAEVYAAATSREQANIVFGDAKQMVDFSPFMRQRFGIETSQYSIYQPTTNSYFKALSQDRGGTKDGLNVHCAINDELHAHKTADMYDITTNGMASRDQPLGLTITTAGNDQTGVCYRERTIVVAVLQGKSDHERYFGMIFCLDRGDDWKDPKNWAKANPNYGISVKPDYLQSIFEKCKISPSNEAIFRQKHLNEWVGAVDGWISESVWEAAYNEIEQTDFKGVVGFGGYDLASLLDLASFGDWRPKLVNGKVHWHIFAKSYINERVIESKQAINGEKRPDDYPVWRDQGFLIETPGAATDFNRIQEDILQHHIEYPFFQLGHDPYHAQQLTSNLIEQGLDVVEIAQRVQFLSPAMRWIEMLLAEGRLHHNGDPVLKWCVLNVVVKEDAKEFIFPRKISAAKKIDAAVGMIIGAACAMHYDNESVFDLIPGENDENFDDWLSDIVKVGRR